MPPLRVAICSDDKIFSEGLRRILAADPLITVVALPAGRSLNGAARAAGLDVLLLDARTDDACGLSRRLTEEEGQPQVIFIEVPDRESSATDALAAGARGILQRSARPEDLATAIHAVALGQVWAPRHIIVDAWLRTLKHEPASHARLNAEAAHLTAREMEVLHCAAAGLGNREVAEALTISEATVKVHLTRVFQKLGLRGRARLAAVYHDVRRPA